MVFTAVLVASAQRRDVFVASRLDPAIDYDKAPTTDAIAKANQRLADGSLKLAYEPDNGYLRSVLAAFNLPVESQSLVFSQTSFEGDLIKVQNPRALYFNDTTAVGWVRGADELELAAQDPKQGVIFYTLKQQAGGSPRFERNNGALACHQTWENVGGPGRTGQS